MNDNQVRWAEDATADNALSTASRAVAVGKTHFLDKVIVSYATNPAAPKLLQIKDGTTVIMEMYVLNHQTIDLGGVRITTGAAVSAELAAHGGGAGNHGKVILVGWTI